MASEMDYPARGRVITVNDDSVVFAVTGSSYELLLKTAGRYDGPVNEPVEAVIRVKGRKVWTVTGGGNFLKPIVGHLRIMQGRVLDATDDRLIVYVATPIVVSLPEDGMAFDLARGPVAVGARVNITCFPGATFELLKQTAAR